jgi:hypothetical protein
VATNRPLAWAALVLGAALILALLLKKGPAPPEEGALLAFVDPACDLHAGECLARLADGATVALDIEPRPIEMLRPLQVRVRTEGLAVTAAEVDFVGIDVYMGYNRTRLAPADAGRYEAQAMLPVCTEQRMTWEARVLLDTTSGTVVAPYRFTTSQ